MIPGAFVVNDPPISRERRNAFSGGDKPNMLLRDWAMESSPIGGPRTGAKTGHRVLDLYRFYAGRLSHDVPLASNASGPAKLILP